MKDERLFEEAMEIAEKLLIHCKNKGETEKILALVAKLLEVRWPISQKQS